MSSRWETFFVMGFPRLPNEPQHANTSNLFPFDRNNCLTNSNKSYIIRSYLKKLVYCGKEQFSAIQEVNNYQTAIVDKGARLLRFTVAFFALIDKFTVTRIDHSLLERRFKPWKTTICCMALKKFDISWG